jgi:hypothetical protein
MKVQMTIFPVDASKSALLEVFVGSGYSKVLYLPPLVVPGVRTQAIEYEHFSTCAGYSCSCRQEEVKTPCYHPKNKDAVFLPRSAKPEQLKNNGGDDVTITSSDATTICIKIRAANTSGCQNSTGVEGWITATEVYPK